MATIVAQSLDSATYKGSCATPLCFQQVPGRRGEYGEQKEKTESEGENHMGTVPDETLRAVYTLCSVSKPEGL